ncbi:MAG: cobyrinate a,c-diamide synthase [Alphaproteobacteria bacterium]
MTSILIGGVSTGSGKTIITASILRALRNRGLKVSGGKVGPDYIDPKFHAVGSGDFALNLDGWAMSDETLNRNLATLEQRGSDITIIEGVMGLFDGASDGSSSSAEIAKKLNLPVILCLDVFGQSSSISAIVKGFDSLDKDIKISGIILTKVGSDKHYQILKDSLAKHLPHIPLIGGLFRNDIFEIKSRHLGLTTPHPDNHTELNAVLDECAKVVEQQLDLNKLIEIAKPSSATMNDKIAVPPFAKHISIAYDEALSFFYPYIVQQWKSLGIEVSFSSYLRNDPVDEKADAIYLCGGYPELYLDKLVKGTDFKDSVLKHADKGTFIFGECGGFMALGKSITDKDGKKYETLGLLDLETSFEKRKLQLSYRHMELLNDCNLGKKGDVYKGHEFHYSTIIHQSGEPLFKVKDASNGQMQDVGLINGNVAGSYMHLIEKYEQ